MLTGAASSESSFNPEANHDPAYPGGPPTGHGLWGHKHKRIDMRGMSWQQQADAALAEARGKTYAGRIAAARTPEELADAEMYYEGPKGFRPGNPRAGDNYMGRLNSIRRFSAMTAGGAAPTAPIGDQAALDAQNRIVAGRARSGDPALLAEYRRQQNTPAGDLSHVRPGHPDDDRASRTRASDVPYSARGHLSPIQYTRSDGRNPLSDLHRNGMLGSPGAPLRVDVVRSVDHERMKEFHRDFAQWAKEGKLDAAHLMRLNPHSLTAAGFHHLSASRVHNERHGDTFHVHGTDTRSALDHAVKVSARRSAEDRVRNGQG